MTQIFIFKGDSEGKNPNRGGAMKKNLVKGIKLQKLLRK